MNGMRLLFLSGLLLSAAGAVVGAAKDQPATRPATNPVTQPSGKPINQFCAVERDNEVDPRATNPMRAGPAMRALNVSPMRGLASM